MNKKNKPSYSPINNVVFALKKTWENNKMLTICTFINALVIVLLPLIATYLSKYVVELVSNDVHPDILIKYILILSLCILVIKLISNFTMAKIENLSYLHKFYYLVSSFSKTLNIDYDILESPEGQTMLQKAFSATSNNQSGTQQIFAEITNIVGNLIGLLTYSLLIISLSPLIVIVLVVLTLVNYFLNNFNNKWVHASKDQWVPIDRKLAYFEKKSSDPQAAKDIRIYNLSIWFANAYNKLLHSRLSWTKRIEKRGWFIDLFSALSMLIRDFIAYIFLIYKIVNEGMSASDFVFFFGIISMYSSWLLGLIDSCNNLQRQNYSLCDLRHYLDTPSKLNHSTGVNIPKTTPKIVFDNVSFKYPSSQKETLKNLSFEINPGEKIALVGINGAGKTTLVKLLTGLYSVTSGKILVGDNDIKDYNIDEYYKLLSVVFQDICIIPVSIEKNIALCNEESINREKLNNSLMLSGLDVKIQTLHNKEKTLLAKGLFDDSIDLSGGEKQKLALARALYKGGSITILDEPTAALDPIAENEMYLKYSNLTDGNTSIFISHRLSSTRFCDRILFLEDGQIVEEGSHDYLMSINGKYAHMFNLQSHYYKEGAV